MKIVQVVPRPEVKPQLKTLLKKKELELRGTSTTFVRQKEGRWKHKKYPGWIHWEGTACGILIAKIQSRKESSDWQLLQAFVGYLDRHFGTEIESINVLYR
jgi:hypothetical protein